MKMFKMLTQRPLGILLSFGVVCVFLAIAVSLGLRWQKNHGNTPAALDREPVTVGAQPTVTQQESTTSSDSEAENESSPVQESVVSPSALKPATPESPAPATPDAPAPATPESPAPATPESPAPATPESPAPATPESPTPATPDAPAPATPDAPAPATPESPAPATPESPAPAAPESPAPATPESPAPATPEASAKPAVSSENWVPLNPLGGDSIEIVYGPPPPATLEILLKEAAAAAASAAPAKEQVLDLNLWHGVPHPVPGAFVGVPHPVPATPVIVDASAAISTKRDMEQTRDLEAEARAINSAPLPQSSGKPSPATSTSKAPAFTSWEVRKLEGRDYVTANSLYRFYRFNSYSVEGRNVWFRSSNLIMKAALGSQEMLINNIKFVLSYPVVNIGGQPCLSRLDLCKLIDPILRPSYIGDASGFDTVIIDAGHGGHDSGARGVYGYEKDFALKLAYALKAVLERQGLKVVMTRRDDTFLSLGGRVRMANTIPRSIYISLHYNSSEGSSATGIETFALSPQGSSSVYGSRSVDAVSFKGNERDSENIALATAVHAAVIHHFKLVDRGVKRARWSVLTGLNRPGILFEGGFVTNPNDARLIAAENFRREMAATIGQAIMNYRRALQPQGRSNTNSRSRRR